MAGITDLASVITETVAGVAISGALPQGIDTGPAGYSAAWVTTYVNNANKAAVAFDILGGVVDDTFTYRITSSGGGTPATGSGTIAADPEHITGVNVTGLTDGTLTLEVTVTSGGLAGNPVTDDVLKDVVAPAGYSVSILSDPIDENNDDAFSFQFAAAVVGTTYDYSIDSSGGPVAPVTGSGTVTSATQTISGINVTALEDGTLTLSVTLTDAAGNVGSAATDTVTKDTTP